MCNAKMSGLIREHIVSKGTCAALTDRGAAEHPDKISWHILSGCFSGLSCLIVVRCANAAPGCELVSVAYGRKIRLKNCVDIS